MGKSLQSKEIIIDTTIELLKKSSGNIGNITVREIAALSGVGIGLIHYHFGSKDLLIEQCVQRIIAKVISSFHPQNYENMTAKNRLKSTTKQVVDFLIVNPEISKISILGDMTTPKIMDNTIKTVMGFMTSFDSEAENDFKNNKILSYCLTLIIQGVFLRKDTTKATMGFDFNIKEERDSFIDFIIDKLLREEELNENINA